MKIDAIYFDMDGTIADLYGYDSWLELLREEDTRPYEEAKPLVKMNQLEALGAAFQALGITLGIISWSAMGGSKDYNKATRKAKMEWINKHCPIFTEFHTVKYGTPKYQVAKFKNAVLVDDNPKVREQWKGYTIDATEPQAMLDELEKLLNVLMGTIAA